jgi:uncharacterized protein YndB with AHSA1/START domain
MSKVLAKDSITLNFPVELVYRTLTDYASYHRWYPKPFKFDILHLDTHAVGTTITIQNGAFVKWLARVSAFEPNKRIAIDYIDGAWVGKTVWKFEPEDGKTKLTLAIDLEINKPWLRFFSKFVNFSKRHSEQMKHVFRSLEHYLGSRRKNSEP